MIRKAVLQDVDDVARSYEELLAHEKRYGKYTAWQQGVYPTVETAKNAVLRDALYIMEKDGEIYGSVILDSVQPEEYDKIQWGYCGTEVLVIHLLCIRPSKAGCGHGSEMIKFAADEARRRGCKAVRLDTGAQNKPAVALYTKQGFRLMGRESMSIGGAILHDNHLFFEMQIS